MHRLSPISAAVTVEYRTVFEKFIFPAVFIALLGFLFFLVNHFVASSYFNQYSVSGMVTMAVILTVLVLLMLGLATSYEFDGNRRLVFFTITFFSFARRFKTADFKDVCAFSVTGIHNRARVHTWWTYKVVMLFKSGRTLAVTTARDKSVHAMNRLAEKLAGTVGCYFFTAEPEQVMHAPVAGEQPIVEFRHWTAADSVAEFWPYIALSLLFFAAILVFVVLTAVSLS